MGFHFASYPVPDRYDLGPVRTHYSEPGRQTIVYRTNEPDTMIALFVYRDSHDGAVPRDERLQRLREIYSGMGWITPQLLADAPESHEIVMVQADAGTAHQGNP